MQLGSGVDTPHVCGFSDRFGWVTDRLKRSDQMSIRVENGQLEIVSNADCNVSDKQRILCYPNALSEVLIPYGYL